MLVRTKVGLDFRRECSRSSKFGGGTSVPKHPALVDEELAQKKIWTICRYKRARK
jgi:hypothetical protein